MNRLAVCAGSFDPLTNGHVAIIARGLRLFDRVHVAVSLNIRKQPMFTADERVTMILAAFPNEPRLEVRGFQGLLATYARGLGAVAILKGIRGPSDLEYEVQMANMNRHLEPDLDTVFVAADADRSFVSSSLVKEVAMLGGDVSALVPTHVLEALTKRIGARSGA